MKNILHKVIDISQFLTSVNSNILNKTKECH